MIISLLLGNLLMVAIAAAGPMYSEAALQRALTQNLSNYYLETNKDPGTLILRNDTSSASSRQYDKIMQSEELFGRMLQELDVPPVQQVTQYSMLNVKAVPQMQIDGEKDLSIRLAAYSDMDAHIQIINGETYRKALDERTIDVIVSERTLATHRLMLGQMLELPALRDASAETYRVRIAGTFENSEEQDPYWTSSPTALTNVFFMDEGLFKELFLNEKRVENGISIDQYAILDYTAMEGDQVGRYLEVLEEYRHSFTGLGQKSLAAYCEDTLTAFVPEAQKANTTIWVLLLPIFVLLAAFIFMVSRQMLEMEQNEISIYKSRGANKRQIISVYLIQSLIIALVSFAGGIFLGMFICRMLGASNSFLEFVNRAALPLKLSPEVFLTAGAAALFSVCTMVFPVFKYANVNIVAHKRQKNRADKRPLWQTLFLDVILLGISIYGLYQYTGQKEYLVQRVLDGASLDPLLYFCSSLFMIGCGLVILRIFPWLVRLVFWLGKKWWSPALYTSFLRIIRTKTNQGFLMVFLILTVAMGVFNAQAARTINANAQDKIQYMTGADIVLREVWDSNEQVSSGAATPDASANQRPSEIIYEEPDYGKYLTMDGIESVTKVFVDQKASVSVEGGKISNAMLMGIHTKEFGETVWFKENLLPVHYYEYLNALSQNSQAVLVSSNFRDIYGYRVGDVLNYSGEQGNSMRGIICGFVDYWPAYAPVVLTKGPDGSYRETDNFLIVAHLAQLQASWGVMPYQVWIKAEDSSRFIYEYAAQTGTRYPVFQDASAELIALKNDPVFQGTNGILTIGFICILLLCTMGFLIYWILSIRSRTLQFGIFRAMGMSMREIITMLINEQLFITGVSIGAGALVGALTSRLFIPLIQIAYSSADQALPLEIVSESSDYVQLFTVIGVVILICMFILGGLISKIKISQALKLGED